MGQGCLHPSAAAAAVVGVVVVVGVVARAVGHAA
jgi:hypothetical protein